ncbi:aryl-alcohol dehydrogenase-like predicted oxidoreductase [Arthrobacter sp. V4I6]|uniref:aldo/keto reductase n=1 Tax=unclassified Arthrobacter TaxID=235627 RepID=UPI002780536E|nr:MULTISPECIES: aldo/keto reductase [unclassified Arthrobacter]MDQ0823296.1 aryl-alcohol dehydrogenase-like predicted oxidoreductase [Arthrobacter sp. V1I7]MDQ0852927.1 aryl-alcohol dehydrogenase-like predicted oxidoreductase [Arthrobacter sp. V4I6]
MLERRPFGETALNVSVVGLGAGQIGEHDVTEAEAAEVLNGALDLGVTLIDTAASYGLSEERIGRHLHRRRDEFVLSTKGGPSINGQRDWTPGSVLASIERSLRLTQSERIDIFYLHSCPIEILRRGDLQETLDKAVAAGKIGVAGYSGDNKPLAFAVDSSRFGSIETSVNIADQWNLRHVLGRRPELGVIAKRPIANAPWRFVDRPTGHYAELYWERLQALKLDPGDMDWTEFALRFTAYAPGVHTAIVGTAKLAHLRRNITAVSRGPLQPEALGGIDRAWREVGSDWSAST